MSPKAPQKVLLHNALQAEWPYPSPDQPRFAFRPKPVGPERSEGQRRPTSHQGENHPSGDRQD